MPYRRNYPATVAEVIDDSMGFKPETLAAVRAFARSKPWRGTELERVQKFHALHAELCRIYGKQTTVTILPSDRPSNRSNYRPAEDKITLIGRLSVVTYLHEFGHALGKDERQTCRWSLNLFKRCFPRSFARAGQSRHMLMSQERASGSSDSGSSGEPSGDSANVNAVGISTPSNSQGRVQ